MSLADKYARIFRDEGMSARSAGIAVQDIRELESSHAEAVRLLRDSRLWSSPDAPWFSRRDAFLADHDKQTGTGEPVRPATKGMP